MIAPCSQPTIERASTQELISCPNCNMNQTIHKDNKANSGHCYGCQTQWSWEEDNILRWGNLESQKKLNQLTTIFHKIKNQFHPMSNWLLPFRHITYFRDREYYKRTLYDYRLATRWAQHYLKDLNLNKGDLILDHGCGKGRIIGLANQMGFICLGQDIKKNAWWRHISNSFFQVVPPEYNKLPWRSYSFSAIFIFGVMHYLDKTSLVSYIKEIHRILKPGGYVIMVEANSKGYAACLPLKQIGRLHSLETIQTLCQESNFKELSLSYEGFYAPLFPLFINFFRKQFTKTFDPLDFDSYLESITPPERRALWLMRIQKQDSPC